MAPIKPSVFTPSAFFSSIPTSGSESTATAVVAPTPPKEAQVVEGSWRGAQVVEYLRENFTLNNVIKTVTSLALAASAVGVIYNNCTSVDAGSNTAEGIPNSTDSTVEVNSPYQMAKLPTIVDSEDKESKEEAEAQFESNRQEFKQFKKDINEFRWSVDWSPVWAAFDEFEKKHNEYLNEVTEVAEAEEQGVSTVNHWFQTPAGRNDVSENNPFSQNYAPENNQSEVPEPTTALALYEPTTVEATHETALALFETTLPNRPIVNENGEDPLYHLNKETIALRPTIISEAQVSEDSTI